MKKIIISILAVLMLSTGSLFAYSYNSIDDIVGFGIGAGYSSESYKQVAGTQKDTSLMLSISLSDFTFLSKSAPVGLYFDAGMLVDLNSKSVVDGTELSESSVPAILFDFAFGFGSRVNLGGSAGLLIGFGPEFYYTSKEYKGYSDEYHERYTYTNDYLTFGLAADVEYQMDLGSNLYLGAGAKASVMFLSTTVRSYSSWSHYTENSSSLDDYIGFRITPRITLFYKY